MREIRLVLVDEVNAFFDGLTRKEIAYVIDKTKIFDPAARQTAAFQLGHDDGYRSFMDSDGLFFQHMIPDVLDHLENFGVDLDCVELLDEREANDIDLSHLSHVNSFFLLEETGFTLRDHQRDAINAVIDEHKGIIDHGTSSGKTATILGISKVLDGTLKVIVVVPSEMLAKQTFEYYEKTNLNAIRLDAKIKGKKREAAFQEYDHIIITNKLLLNCLEFIRDLPFALLVDEVHAYFGENFAGAMRDPLSNCPIRIGLTGTVPKDKLKRTTIVNHLGGGVITTMKAKNLIKQNQAASLNIELITTSHPEMKDLSSDRNWEWETERRYINSHKGRIAAIADYIKSLPKKNTLVISHAASGKLLADHFDGRMIVDETPVETREEWVSVFDTQDEAVVFGSFGTIAAGLSKNRIFRIIMIDPGKGSSVIQSIGRGIRLDGVVNHVEIIDISADTKYAVRHRKERIKIYKEESYPFEQLEEAINVEDYE